MKTCIICTIKHVSSAEWFVHEALTGYPKHITKAYGQLDHAEMEVVQQWPEVAFYIHQAKKFVSDAIDNGDVTIAKEIDFDGLQTLLLTVEGHENLVDSNPDNAKFYDEQVWIRRGRDIRFKHNLPCPEEYYIMIKDNKEHEQVLAEITKR